MPNVFSARPRKLLKRAYIEIGNICNLKCDFCPEVERSKKLMSVGEFHSILSKLTGRVDEITLHLMGEPLAHPNFAEITEVTRAQNIPVVLTTNGTLLGVRNNRELLLKSGFKQINFSIQSLFSNFPMEDAWNHFSKILDFAAEASLQQPELYINFRFWNINEPIRSNLDSKSNPNLWHSNFEKAQGPTSNPFNGADHPRQKPDQSNARALAQIADRFSTKFSDKPRDVQSMKSLHVRGRIYVHFDSRFVWPSLDQPVRSIKGTCMALTHHVGIHADGTVVPCCLDKEAVLPLGNIHQETLEEILKSNRAQTMKEGFRTGTLTERLCRGCNYAKRFDIRSSKMNQPKGKSRNLPSSDLSYQSAKQKPTNTKPPLASLQSAPTSVD